MKTNSKLYLVATPIGNIKEITQRALEVLSDVDIIYCEDTRVSKKLLFHYNIKTRLESLFLKNMVLKENLIIDNLKSGLDIAIISDAGLPVISDPGYEVVIKAKQEGFSVIPIGGVSSITSALIASGLEIKPFIYLGFLPKKEEKIKKELLAISFFQGSVVILESPNRVLKTLKLIYELFGDVKASFAREISKVYEEIKTDSISNLIAVLSAKEKIRGEFVLMFYKEKLKNLKDVSLEERLNYYLCQGLTKQEATKQIAEDLNKSKKEIYKQLINEEK